MSKVSKSDVEVIELASDELSDFASLSMCSTDAPSTKLSQVVKAIGSLVAKAKK
jgi:hypothetical protein